MAKYTTDKLRNAISFKGPLFYSKYMPEILDKIGITHPCNVPVNIFKKHAKSFILECQSCDTIHEWGEGTLLYTTYRAYHGLAEITYRKFHT